MTGHVADSSNEALELDESLNLSLTQRAGEEPTDGKARVRMEWGGVCGSDLHVLRTGDWVSYWPAILGHEGVGVVESCPGGTFTPGTRVVIDSRVGCGKCDGCAISTVYCNTLQWVGEVYPGTFQRHAVFPVSALVPCPANIDPAVAVLAEPLAVAVHAANLAGEVPQRVLLIGFGPIGALVHTELTRRRPDVVVTVAEIDPKRLQLARAAGAEIASNPSGSWPLVIDAAGYSGSMGTSLDAASIGGTVVLVGIGHTAEQVTPQLLVEKSISLRGSHGFTNELPAAVAIIAADPQRYRWIITDAYALSESPIALAQMAVTPATGKAVIKL